MKVETVLVEQNLQIYYAWLGNDLKSKVTRGENSGKDLYHDFVVLKYGTLGALENGKNIIFVMPSNLQKKTNALVVWLEDRGVPRIAAGKYL